MGPWWVQLVIALSAVGGVTAATLRMIWKVNPSGHNRKKCHCAACVNYRGRVDYNKSVRRFNKQIDRQSTYKEVKGDYVSWVDPSSFEVSERYLSTAELEENMVVGFRGVTYLVKQVACDQEGYLVSMVSMATRLDIVVTVSFKIGNQRMWIPQGGRERGMPRRKTWS